MESEGERHVTFVVVGLLAGALKAIEKYQVLHIFLQPSVLSFLEFLLTSSRGVEHPTLEMSDAFLSQETLKYPAFYSQSHVQLPHGSILQSDISHAR